ncbi:MAG: DEAD/DEAH box helicase [Prolixibacteraceae bacterium]|jgi:SNF2 family DNA or RNA helicase|nr:DEAD/DEAH box helicase [Prolixibacteraceae bacterium]
MDIKLLIKQQIEKLQNLLDKTELALGEIIFNNNGCQVLSQSAVRFELIVDTQSEEGQVEYVLQVFDEDIIPTKNSDRSGWDRYAYACLLQVENELHLLDPKEPVEHKKYSREGMIKRVMLERRQKAEKANYRIKWASNIYGDHILTNENGIKYKVFLRDFENETGYSDSMDSRLNKLGTTKHIMYAFRKLKEDKALFDRLSKTCPFIEVFCDPLNEYKITWHYPSKMSVDEQLLLSRYFKHSSFIEDSELKGFLGFIEESVAYPRIRIRPEVQEKIETAFEEGMLENLKSGYQSDYSPIKGELFPYQKEGIDFALFRKTAIIADEMGLGKTIQAIGTAVLKKGIFDFRKTLVVCPASLKEQWKKEIEKFSYEKALIIEGFPYERERQYSDNDHFFFIVNYETILRDQLALNKAGFDFLILDEAQRIKNFETKTASSIRRLQFKHVLIITGTPIENRLIDIFSIVSAINPSFFGPLWEFSYQHCLFDPEKHNKINGYYNLQKLNKQLEPILIRREKRKVLDQLPNVQQINVPVNLSPLQADYHASYAKGIAAIIRKKFLTPYDLQKLQLLLASMRMVCDSTYLIDEETNESPKLEELKYILLEKLDVVNSDSKIIIFSEWVKVHKLIGHILRENNIGFTELNGSVPVKLRGELIRKFETNPHCKIFLSTEAGGSGLNLQVANTLINFELPWNPAKKNQRIGRIDRLGQKSNKLTIFNFITRNSIEQQIASGLLVKQNLFDGVLDGGSKTNSVDFSTKGRSQFIQQLEEFITETENTELVEPSLSFADEVMATTENLPEPDTIDLTEEIEEVQPSGEPSLLPEKTEALRNQEEKAQEIEQVMNNGMQFLAGLFKMSTGKDLGLENQTIEVNKETGEVVMKFKLPVF